MAKVIMLDSVVNTIETAEDIGKTQYQRFVEKRIDYNVTAFHDTIWKNSLPLFNSGSGQTAAKSTSKISILQHDVLNGVHIKSSYRDRDEHENHAWPPSLAH